MIIKLLAEEHEGIQSDLTVIGKALSGGFYPVSAVLSTEAVLGVLNPGQHGSTFGGNPLACAIARVALKVLVEEGLNDDLFETITISIRVTWIGSICITFFIVSEAIVVTIIVVICVAIVIKVRGIY